MALPNEAVTMPRLDARLEARDPPVVVVSAAAGTQPIPPVAPVVIYRRGSYEGVPATLAPGERHEWQVSLPPPGSGTVPAVIRLQGLPAADTPAPVVLAVSGPGATAGPVVVTLEAGGEAGLLRARFALHNQGSEPVAGRVVVVLPPGLRTEPESQPVTLAPAARTIVPFTIESRDVRPGTETAVSALFEYGAPTWHTIVARTAITVPTSSATGRPAALTVGATAMLVAFVLLGLAWRAAARRARSSPRA